MILSVTRAAGVVIILGAAAWSYGLLQAGVMPEGVNDQVEIWTSGVFQLGLVALLATMRATDATGTSRVGRLILNAEVVAVALAIGWTIPFLFDANRPSTPVILVLDVFWPLSMVGLIVVGISVVRAARWPRPARYPPLSASDAGVRADVKRRAGKGQAAPLILPQASSLSVTVTEEAPCDSHHPSKCSSKRSDDLSSRDPRRRLSGEHGIVYWEEYE